jgi:ketosteroid isomerase-like protein
MSQDNVDLVHRAAGAFNRRDLAAVAGDFDPEAEWLEDQRYPGAGAFHGLDGVARSIDKWWDAWAEIRMDIDQTIDLDDSVVVIGRAHARGHDSDVTVEAPFAGIFEFRAGKVTRVRMLGGRTEALEALGLSD